MKTLKVLSSFGKKDFLLEYIKELNLTNVNSIDLTTLFEAVEINKNNNDEYFTYYENEINHFSIKLKDEWFYVVKNDFFTEETFYE